MSSEIDSSKEVQSTETLEQLSAIVTRKLPDARLREIVADTTAPAEVRALAHECFQLRAAFKLNRDCDIRDRAKMYRVVLDVLESHCAMRALDDENDRIATARAIARALVPGTFVDLSEHDDELEAHDPHATVKQ